MENTLVVLSKDFSVKIINLRRKIDDYKMNSILNQVLRSATSIGANIHEANYASSRVDFINKLQISLKECYETDYWLELLMRTEIISNDEFTELYNDCCKLRKLLTASIKTAKNNNT